MLFLSVTDRDSDYRSDVKYLGFQSTCMQLTNHFLDWKAEPIMAIVENI
jgi:hypothetical protein